MKAQTLIVLLVGQFLLCCTNEREKQEPQATIEVTYSAPGHRSTQLPTKDIEANKRFAGKVKSAAENCASIRLRKYHIRDTANKPAMTISPSEQAELCRILSKAQPVQKEAECYATPAYHVWIDFLSEDGSTILSLRDDFICKASLTTQLAQIELSDADARRLRDIISPKKKLTPGEQHFTIRMEAGKRLDLSAQLQRLVPEMGEHDLNGVLRLKNRDVTMSVHTTSKGNGSISLPGIELPFYDDHDNGSVFSPPMASLVLDDTNSLGTQLHVSYTELSYADNDKEGTGPTSHHVCKTYLYQPQKACFTEK